VDKDLKSKTFAELERLVTGLGQKKYIAGYIFGFIHTRGVTDISAITPLSKSFRSRLTEQGYYISKLEVIEKLTDPDGTVKYVFGLPDGKRIESVLLFDPVKSKRFPGLSPGNSPVEFKEFPGPSPRNPKGIPEGKGISQGEGRRTLCVSTQAGCAMGCVFCATGRGGLKRPAEFKEFPGPSPGNSKGISQGNLTAGEIVDQVNAVSEQRTADSGQKRTERCTLNAARCINNVVFMGMGEPLVNYEAVLDAVRILNHPEGRKIGIRHITISTCGLPEGIERLADEDIQPRLAISLNAPTDAIRQKLMPIAKKYSLDRLFRAVEVYQHKTHNRVTFEYCMIKGVNDTVLHARLLVKRLCSVRCNVNLIEYNPHPSCSFRPSGQDAIERFANTLSDAGLETTVRLKMGQTINAACGQLGAGK
jgi:23S rRNA (adenine2503-C2)-methyltransferase